MSYYKVKYSSELISIFMYFLRINVYNIMRYLILSNIFSYFSWEIKNARYLVLSFSIIYSCTLLKMIHKAFSLYKVLYAIW